MYDINLITDYTIWRLDGDSESESDLINLKLQKLLYYIQAWHLAFTEAPLFDGKFQAWIHGPVNRAIYDRFKFNKTLYSSIGIEDISSEFKEDLIDENSKVIINNVLDIYAQYSGYQLELMTHREEPWLKARAGYTEMQRCENEIDERLMHSFYKGRL